MTIKNLHTYYERMESSLGDKVKIVDNVKSGNILEVGFGSGSLLKVLEELGNDVFGIDNSIDSVNYALENGLENVFLGDANDIEKVFEGQMFDTIIFCSMIHEVFSYERNKHTESPLYMANLQGALKVNQLLEQAYKLLKDDGKIIIRDGLKVPIYKENNLATFTLKNDELYMLDDYRNFHFNEEMQFNLTKKNNDETLISSGLNDAMEFLYTYTWGKDSMEHERQERYGFLSLSSYMLLLESIGFENVNGVSYLQSGYIENLNHLGFLDLTEVSDTLPDSNMILVGRK